MKLFQQFIMILFIASAVSLFGPGVLYAETKADKQDTQKKMESEKKEGGLAIKDLPAPIPNVFDGIQRIGNEIGEGITKATGKTADVLQNAIQEKDSDEGPK